MLIPLVLVIFIRRRRDLPFPWMFWMFGVFILGCGLTHFMEVVTFYDPLYRLSGLVKAITAAASVATVVALVPLVPLALALRSPEELEREIADRRKAEASLQRLSVELEDRVVQRTRELAQANDALHAEMARRQRAQEEREAILQRERQARAEAESANRAKDEFLATLSHELRTPLNAMLGWSHLLRRGNLSPETAHRGIEVLERNTKAQAQLIDDLLDVSRITTGKLRLQVSSVDLPTVIEAAMDAIRPAAEAKGIQLDRHLEPEAPPVSGDPTRLQQVVWNLLSNAVKFTGPGGLIEVRLERRSGQLVLTVRDNGQGIAPDFLPHAFERFRQADSSTTRAHGGLGLGLAIVRYLVELHGGTVRAESEGVGKGATFTIELPVGAVRPAPPADGGPAQPRQRQAAGPRRGLVGARVLVVDDEADARDMLSLVLADCGALVTAVSSASEALEALPRLRPAVLVSDIGMPGEDGYALIRRVRLLPPEQGGDVPAAALTAFARPEERSRALHAGYQMHLSKPVDPGDLADVVEHLAAWGAR